MLSKAYIKYIQSLHHKKFRDEHEAFIAEGTKIVQELLATEVFECTHIVALKEWLLEHESGLNLGSKLEVFEVKPFELERLSALATPNQVLAVFKKKEEQEVMYKNNLVLMLDDVQDPGNMGTIIRIADWFGVNDIICSINSVDIYNTKVVQSSMASIARVNVEYKNLREILHHHKSTPVYAAVLDGKNVASFKKISEGIIVLGNESKGISSDIIDMADEKISIPKIGEAESLNVAVATGIILSYFAGI